MGSASVVSEVQLAVDDLVGVHGCDTMILGCTHFPLVRDNFETQSGSDVAIVDSTTATAGRLAGVLEETGLTAPTHSPVQHSFLATAHTHGFRNQAKILFGEHIQATRIDIETPLLSAGE